IAAAQRAPADGGADPRAPGLGAGGRGDQGTADGPGSGSPLPDGPPGEGAPGDPRGGGALHGQRGRAGDEPRHELGGRPGGGGGGAEPGCGPDRGGAAERHSAAQFGAVRSDQEPDVRIRGSDQAGRPLVAAGAAGGGVEGGRARGG